MGREGGLGLGIDWSFSSHVGQINNRGETLIHETGLRCTCNLEDTYAGQMEQTHVPRKRRLIGCDQCDGSGFIYRNPKTIVAMITDIREDYSRDEAGWAVPGDCIMSVKPDYNVTPGDLVTFTWSHPIPDGQVIMRGAGTTSDNAPLDTELEEDEDRLWYGADKAVWCEDETGISYASGADFELNTSKVLKWTGNRPKKGQIYTIKYYGFLEWVAFTPPNIRRDRDRDLGSRVLLRKKHIAHVNSAPRTTQRDKIPFCSKLESC